ncbi:class I SAM-dependent methyltransferase [Paenibacillus ferrarius]|uniref:class I SAM-dependent methyltransferase n=1 Tax=Paenibacillus ferrarius TaxID=1469647 RepID=UPI003D2E92A3
MSHIAQDMTSVLIEAMQADPRGCISFHDYMQLCLYHETQGYYRQSREKIGKRGDFYTSSSIGTVMGEMIAQWLCSQIKHKPEIPLHLVEWGGGNGRMALHVLDEIRREQPDIYERLRYTMVESSPYHRGLQRETLSAHSGKVVYVDGEDWLAEPPQKHVYVLANELLDAFPVHRLEYRKGDFFESHVAWSEQDQAFTELWLPDVERRVLDAAKRLKVQWQEGQIVEINLAAEDWIADIARRMAGGALLIIDYGDREEELYAAHRKLGTLMCYYRHQAHSDPFLHPGEQDLTAHVDFSQCRAVAEANGLVTAPLQTQREFLVAQGILEKLQTHYDPNPFSEVSKRNRSIRQLLLSDGMSELFKVFVATKS